MVTSPSLKFKSLFLFFSISLSTLPIKSLLSALKASKISGNLLLRSSQDTLVSGCIPKLQTGTWKVEDAVSSCENDIKTNQVSENSHYNRHGLGCTTTPKFHDTNLQSITRDIFQNTTNQLMAPMFSPKLSNCKFRVSGQDG